MSELPVVVLAAGHGGIAELQEHVDFSSVQWALLQFCVGEGTLRRQRLLFLHINGKDCPPIPRGRANELTASVQRALREGSGGTAEAFHASVEVKGSEEVTVENLLQRVLPFFVVDKEEYSVQWLQSHYDRQLRDAKKSEPKVVHVHEPPATQGGGAAASAKRGTIFELGNTTFSTGRDALKAVAEPLGPWNWAFFTGGTELTVVAGGIGSVEEMRTCYEEHPEDVLFGLLRLGFGEGRLRRTKYVFIHAIGDRVPAVTRGRLSAQRPQMEEIMGNYASISVTMELLTTSDLTLNSVVDRVRRAVVVDDEVLARDKATPSVFSVEAFEQALQEEKKSRIEEIRAQRKQRAGAGAGFSETNTGPWSDYSISSMVSLLRSGHENLNWMLLGPKADWLGRRGTVSAAKQLLEPTAGDSPLADSPKTNVSTVVPASPGSCEVVESPEKVNGEEDEEAVEGAVEATPPGTPRPSISFQMMRSSTVRLSGPLLKRSGAWHGFWQLRWFQVRGGSLMWWASPSMVSQEPAGVLPLRDMKVQRKGATQFTLECAGKKKIYLLDADADTSTAEANWISDFGAWPAADVWVKAMEEESILHPGMSAEGDALATAGKDLLRSLLA